MENWKKILALGLASTFGVAYAGDKVDTDPSIKKEAPKKEDAPKEGAAGKGKEAEAPKTEAEKPAEPVVIKFDEAKFGKLYKTGKAWIDDGLTSEELKKLGAVLVKSDKGFEIVFVQKGELAELPYKVASFTEREQAEAKKHFVVAAQVDNDKVSFLETEVNKAMIDALVKRADHIIRADLEEKAAGTEGSESLMVVGTEDGKQMFAYLGKLGVNISSQEADRFGLGKDAKDAVESWIEVRQKTVKSKDKEGKEIENIVNEFYMVSEFLDGSKGEKLVSEDYVKGIAAKLAEVAAYESSVEMVVDPKTKVNVPKAAYDRAVELSALRDSKDGNTYSHTLKELKEVADYKHQKPGHAKYLNDFIDEVKQGFMPQNGWTPIASKKVDEYLAKKVEEGLKGGEPDKKVAKEDIAKGVAEARKHLTYKVSFVEGGRCEFQVTAMYEGEKVFTKKMNVTPGKEVGGNFEQILIEALNTAGYTN